MKTLALALAFGAALASSAAAQSAPPAGQPGTISPMYVPIFGVTAGIALPVGRLADDHAAGYTLGGLVEYAVAGQPYALRGELLYQRFALKSGRTVGSDVNLTSLGATIVVKSFQPTTASNTFFTGGIAVYHGTDLGTRPGVNAGGGIEIPLTGFSATGEARLHVMFADGRPVLTIPLTVGIRF
ncbi:MAG: hypothetical protein JWN79_3452 [Gemmatimonadetes bacterium]|jgi:hypothetical protein|nr:hypothetical protein [Gemmatimonadota bacterium]